jgi:hypothetical protein
MSTRSLGLAAVLLLAPWIAPGPADAGNAAVYCRVTERHILSLERRAARRCDDFTGCTEGARRGYARKARAFADACVHLNQVQVLGTHNSYHIRPADPLWSALLAFSPVFHQLEYTHLPLDQQFETQGIRQIEIDVFADPAGGLYSVRHGLIAVGLDPVSHVPELSQPGFKVLHLQDLDFLSRCVTFIDCLQDVKQWSDAHPHHLPIMILIEAKDDVLPDPLNLGFVTPIPIGTPEFDALDGEILSVFPPEQLITPDDVRGTHASVEEAVLAGGWPTLGEARGRVLFTLDNASKRDAYLGGHPGLAGRVLFTNASPGDPDAGFVEENDPHAPEIPDLIRAGYIVRTRADADTEQARTGDTTDRDAAIASGAQYVSTDYPVPNPDFGTGYFVAIPDGTPGRCNPVNAPAGCRSAFIETLP